MRTKANKGEGCFALCGRPHGTSAKRLSSQWLWNCQARCRLPNDS